MKVAQATVAGALGSETVIVTAREVSVLPALSLAIALRTWEPFEEPAVFQDVV